MALFTIVIPTKDRPELLKEAVDSVIAQTFSDWELIIVDDHSRVPVSLPYSGQNSYRISIILNVGIGRSAARNTGVQRSTTDYVCFLDDDDWINPSFLQTFYEAIPTLEKGQLLRQAITNVYDDGKKKQGFLFDTVVYKSSLEFVLTRMTGLVTFCFPRQIFDTHLLDPRFSLWEDSHFLLRVLEKYEIKQIPAYNYYYRIHQSMGSRGFSNGDHLHANLKTNLEAMEDYFDNHAPVEIRKKWKHYLLSEKLAEYATSDLVYAEGKRAMHYFRDSLKHGFYLAHWKSYINFFRFWLKKNLLSQKQ